MEVDPLSTEFTSYDPVGNHIVEHIQESDAEVIKELPIALPLPTIPSKDDANRGDSYNLILDVKAEKIDEPDLNPDITHDYTTYNSEQPVESKTVVVKKEKKSKKLKEKVVVKKERKRWQRRVIDYSEENPEGVKFYGCAVCDVKYTSLQTLQYHVTEHKNRLTSWDLRVKNQRIRKKLKKEKKRLKKLKLDKIKQEDIKVEDVIQTLENLKDTSDVNIINSSDIVNGVSQENNNQNIPKNDEVTSQADKKEMNDNESNGEVNKNDDEKLNLEKIFKCGVCLKQFSLGYYLKLHVRSHTGEKPYHCELCGISFITASKLGRHRKRTHLSIKFECRICRRPYTRLEFLTRHFNKQHAEDKIEGEPYDYNAILPYLKELEEELQRKKEQEALKVEDRKEDLFPSYTSYPPYPDSPLEKPRTEQLWTPSLDDVKLEYSDIVKPEIKEEVDLPEFPDSGHDYIDDEPSMKDEDQTDDEDYFPKDTWLPAASPRLEVTDLSPLKTKNKKSSDPLHCDICDKQIRSLSYMRIHLRTHSGDRPYKCYVCNKGFITASKMNRHIMTHGMDWENDKEQSKTDDTTVKQEIDLDADKDENDPKKKTKRTRQKRSKCPIPQKHKPEYVNGERVNRRKKKRPHACEFCTKRFLYVEALQIHMRSHNGEQRVYICSYCLLKCDDEEGLKQHEACHVGPRPYLCTVCDRTYKKRESMVYHKRMHESEKKYQCDVCPKSFNAQCKLQRHLLSHRPDKYVVRYECPVCAHIFNTKYHIEMHLSTHEKEGVILQENRGQVIAMVMQNARKIPLESDNPTNLKNLIPSDERSRICNICGEIFNHFYYLEQHLKTHGSKFSIENSQQQDMNERKHICKVCNKGFKLSYYLKLHSFTHTKEKPYICQQCGKGFITKGKLKRHLETHAGLKKYQCHICCKFFTRPSYLRIHVRTIHGNQDYNFKADTDYDVGMPLADACMSVMSHGSV